MLPFFYKATLVSFFPAHISLLCERLFYCVAVECTKTLDCLQLANLNVFILDKYISKQPFPAAIL